ncbi:MAG TPA: AMP-binding protein [Gemmatimonadaceae bacterium]|nr:AMP-binding protein [Gemmatimonadaceae bacterium]
MTTDPRIVLRRAALGATSGVTSAPWGPDPARGALGSMAATDLSLQRQPEFTEEQAVRRIEDIVRELALELSGDRAARAVTPTASLERDVGLGSLERVELLTRIEAAFQRELGDAILLLDTVREIARALMQAPALVGLAERTPSVAALPLPAATSVDLGRVATLVEALQRRATAEPTRVHVHVRVDSRLVPLSYAELWDGARRIAAGLAAHGVRRGETVAIMLPTGIDYLQAFMGVLAAGALAVPLYPPARLDRMQEYLQRQGRILANAHARLLIAMPEAGPVARMLRGVAPALAEIVTADQLRLPGDISAPATPDARDLALVQYTSGSTGDPKGVSLSHANLIANIRAIAEAIALRPTDVAVSWLPLYHDMGLIGTWLNAMAHGIPLLLMSPLAFLARPERWLWAIHTRRATLSAAPNFAYELCLRKVRDDAIEGLDLSSWRCATNGSEPVSAATIERFTQRFRRYGFRPEAMLPVYGLAESAVALTFPPLGRRPRVDAVARDTFATEGRATQAPEGDKTSLRFVSVGRPLARHEIRIVNDAQSAVPERVVGRVLFRGPSCMSAYYDNPAATSRAVLADGWIDSGDLGYLTEGELFVTGRVKDLIIKAGRNLVPQEIEEVVGSVDGIRKGCVAAFGVADESGGTERLVVLAETHAPAEERERLEHEIVARVAADVGVPPDVARVVPPGVVPKTPSGKVRRAAARDAFAAGSLSGVRRVPWRLRLRVLVGAAQARVESAGRATLRALQVAYLVLVWTIALVLLGPLVWVLMHLLPAGRPVRALARVVSRIALAISGCPVDVEHRDRLPRRGPMVLVTNHLSYADTPALVAALPIDVVIVAMKEIIDWRLIGTFARRGRHPLVDRWHLKQSLTDAAELEGRLRGGEAILFFAEGGFTRASGLRPFRLGAFEIAVAAGAPVVPVALRGTRQLLPADTRVPHPRRIHVWIGEPLRATGTGWSAAVDLRDRAADAVALHCGEPRRDPVAVH